MDSLLGHAQPFGQLGLGGAVFFEFNDTVLKDSRASRLVAGKNFTVHANQVENRYSLMAANGNLDLTADSLLNQGAASRSGQRVVIIGTPGRIDNSLWDKMEFIDVPAFNAATAAGNFDEVRFKELSDRSSDSRFAVQSDVTTWNENGNNVYAAVLQAGEKRGQTRGKTGTDHVYPENGREWGQTTFFCVAL